jgi:hypothetical protein
MDRWSLSSYIRTGKSRRNNRDVSCKFDTVSLGGCSSKVSAIAPWIAKPQNARDAWCDSQQKNTTCYWIAAAQPAYLLAKCRALRHS